jgi:glucan phosphoethanolaminetransferase (alkaline phosphatase superfamily)
VENSDIHHTLGKYSRPHGVTLLAVGVLIIAVYHLIRLIQAIVQWQTLGEIRDYLPLYMIVSGAFWGIAGLLIGWGLWSGRSWAPRVTRWVALLFAIFYWVDRLFVQTAAGQSANTVFVVVMTVVLLGWIYWILSRLRTRLFFGELHAYQPKNSETT